MFPVVNLNGALLPGAEARVSPLDHAFLYGCGLFETLRMRGGRLFALERHLGRLAASAAELGLALPPTAVLEQALRETARANGVSECVLRLTVSPGLGEASPDAGPAGPTQFLVTARPAPPPRKQGGTAAITGLHPGLPHKSTSYLPFLLARRRARAQGADEALLTREGRLVEGATSNLFLVRGGRVLTPPLASGCLPGITRGVLFDLAPAAGVDLAEADLTPTDLAGATEAFLTNAVSGVTPLVAVDGAPIGPGHPGPVTARLARAYEEMAAG